LLDDALKKTVARLPVKAGNTDGKFKPPSLIDIATYIANKGYSFDPAAFIAHYESNGWKVGRNKMKSWKAACTTWAKRDQANPKATTKQVTIKEDLTDRSWAG